jgi:hypothetical protein
MSSTSATVVALEIPFPKLPQGARRTGAQRGQRFSKGFSRRKHSLHIEVFVVMLVPLDKSVGLYGLSSLRSVLLAAKTSLSACIQ